MIEDLQAAIRIEFDAARDACIAAGAIGTEVEIAGVLAARLIHLQRATSAGMLRLRRPEDRA